MWHFKQDVNGLLYFLMLGVRLYSHLYQYINMTSLKNEARHIVSDIGRHPT